MLKFGISLMRFASMLQISSYSKLGFIMFSTWGFSKLYLIVLYGFIRVGNVTLIRAIFAGKEIFKPAFMVLGFLLAKYFVIDLLNSTLIRKYHFPALGMNY